MYSVYMYTVLYSVQCTTYSLLMYFAVTLLSNNIYVCVHMNIYVTDKDLKVIFDLPTYVCSHIEPKCLNFLGLQ
jgi:hypothetical protein